MLTIACPGCRSLVDVDPSYAGRTITCGTCGTASVVPRPGDILRPGPVIGAIPPASTTCPRCCRLVRVPADKLSGWMACPSCALVFAGSPVPPPARRVPPPLPPPFPPTAAGGDHRPTGRLRLVGLLGLLALLILSSATTGWLIGRRTGPPPATGNSDKAGDATDRSKGEPALVVPAGKKLDRAEDVIDRLKDKKLISAAAKVRGNPEFGLTARYRLRGAAEKADIECFMLEFEKERDIPLYIGAVHEGTDEMVREIDAGRWPGAFRYGRFLFMVGQWDPRIDLVEAIRSALR